MRWRLSLTADTRPYQNSLGSQDLILGSRVAHLRELKAELAKVKAENAALRDENAALASHFDLALVAAEDLRALPPEGKLVIIDGWNLILGARKEAKNPADLIAQANAHLREHPADRVWIIFDGPRENSTNDGKVRVSYTGGIGTQRADRFICDFLRMAKFRGDLSRIEVRTNDKDFKKTIARLNMV